MDQLADSVARPSAPGTAGRQGAVVWWLLIGLVLVGGIALRFRHLGAKFDHYDEVFPVGVVAHVRSTGNLDVGVKNAPGIPDISRGNQYTWSGYYYVLLGWDSVGRLFPGWPGDQPVYPSLLRLRAFSAFTSSLALALLAFAAWRDVGPRGAFVASALMAFDPTLVQDAHYARPEGLLVLLTVGFIWVVARIDSPGRRRAILAGVLLGVLIAAKNTMGLMALLPLLWLVGSQTRRRAWTDVSWCLGVGLIAFAAAEPGAWLHFADFRGSIRLLQLQYSSPFPVSGPPGGGTSYAMAGSYFLATLGIGTIGLAIIGAAQAASRRTWWLLLAWGGPLLVYAAYFGAKTIFFERAYTSFLPGLFLIAGWGAEAIVTRVDPVGANVAANPKGSRRGGAATLLLAAIAVLPGALITVHFVGDVLSGDFDARRVAYEQKLASTLPQVPVIGTPMWSPAHIAAIADRWNATHAPLIVRVSDYGDAWTAPMYTRFLQQLPAREFETLPGPFADLPVSTLPVYHVPTYHYVWIGPPPAHPLPQPAPAEPGVVLRMLTALVSPSWPYQAVGAVCASIPLVLAVLAVWREERGGAAARRRDEPPGSVSPATSRSEIGIPGWMFPASIFLALFALRWPGFFHHPDLNPDEAHTLAGAITLSFDPIYWKSVDGTTHGPLNDFVLMWSRLFGWRMDFLTARVLGCLLIGGALTWMWAGARVLWGEATARLAVLPPLAFFAFSTFWDFVHYTSEHLSIFLLATGWGAVVMAARRPLPARWIGAGWWALAGLALGAIPYAKMQGGPVALVIAGYGIWVLWRRRSEAVPSTVPASDGGGRPAIAFCGALVLPTIACVVHLWTFNLWHHFWQSYILNNLRYATQTRMYTVPQMLVALPQWLRDAEGLRSFALGILVFIAVTLLLARWFGRRGWIAVLFSLILAAAGLYAAVAPGRQFHHYLLFAVIPWAGVAAATLAATRFATRAGRIGAVIAFLALAIVPQLTAKLHRPNPYLGDVAAYPNRISRVARTVLHFARAGEPLGIWGFMPRYYVETGLPQASREGHNERELLPQPQFVYYWGRYMSDLKRHHPPVFLDAVGPGVFWPQDRAHYGHENWPELRDWVAANYRLVDDLDGVRIYVRNDRVPRGVGAIGRRPGE